MSVYSWVLRAQYAHRFYVKAKRYGCTDVADEYHSDYVAAMREARKLKAQIEAN